MWTAMDADNYGDYAAASIGEIQTLRISTDNVDNAAALAKNEPQSASSYRRNGRSASRTVFSRTQLDAMEDRFLRQSFLTREERIELADQIELTERQILVWFQNRRGRLKRKGPADKAYEKKHYYDSMAPDGRGRAFPTSINSCAGPSSGPAAVCRRNDRSVVTCNNAVVDGKFITSCADNGELTQNVHVFPDSQQISRHTGISHGSLDCTAKNPIYMAMTDMVDASTSFRMQQHQMMANQFAGNDAGPRYGSVRLTCISATPQQYFLDYGTRGGAWGPECRSWNELNGMDCIGQPDHGHPIYAIDGQLPSSSVRTPPTPPNYIGY